MKQTYREIKKEARRQMKERRYQRDDEGRAIICMTVKNDDEFLSEFSEGDTPVISAAVAEFIENSTCAIPPKEELTLRIRGDCIDEGERVLYTRAIREYYLEQYIAAQREIRRNRWLVCLLGVAGVAVLAAGILYGYLVGNEIWTEVIDIVAWVLIWEATDIGLFETRGLRLRKRRCLSYLSMKVAYLAEEQAVVS